MQMETHRVYKALPLNEFMAHVSFVVAKANYSLTSLVQHINYLTHAAPDTDEYWKRFFVAEVARHLEKASEYLDRQVDIMDEGGFYCFRLLDKDNEKEKKTAALVAEVEKLNSNTPNGYITDADTIFVDTLSTAEGDYTGIAQEIFDIWKKSNDRSSVEEMFNTILGITFADYLYVCEEKITRE